MGYLAQYTERAGAFSGGRVSCEKYGNFLNNLTRLMDAKHSVFSECGACHSELMLMFAALDNAADNGESITVAKAAKRLGVSMPSVSRSLKSLSEKGFVKRDFDEKDRRSVRIVVTEAGEDKIQDFLRCIFAKLDTVLAVFSDEELAQMIELQDRFVNSLIKTLKGEQNVRNKEYH